MLHNQCGRHINMSHATFFFCQSTCKSIQILAVSSKNVDWQTAVWTYVDWHWQCTQTLLTYFWVRVLCIFSIFPHICTSRYALKTNPNLKMPKTNYTECNLFIICYNFRINNSIVFFQFSLSFKQKNRLFSLVFENAFYQHLWFSYILK